MQAPTTNENTTSVIESTTQLQLPTTTGGSVASTFSAAGQFAQTLGNPIVAVTVTAVAALLAIAYVVSKLA